MRIWWLFWPTLFSQGSSCGRCVFQHTIAKRGGSGGCVGQHPIAREVHVVFVFASAQTPGRCIRWLCEPTPCKQEVACAGISLRAVAEIAREIHVTAMFANIQNPGSCTGWLYWATPFYHGTACGGCVLPTPNSQGGACVRREVHEVAVVASTL